MQIYACAQKEKYQKYRKQSENRGVTQSWRKRKESVVGMICGKISFKLEVKDGWWERRNDQEVELTEAKKKENGQKWDKVDGVKGEGGSRDKHIEKSDQLFVEKMMYRVAQNIWHNFFCTR